MSNLLEYIAKRRDELRAQKKAINIELRQLKAAEAAARTEMPQGIVDSNNPSPKSSGRGKPTIQDFILAVLRRFPEGIDANQINDEIRSEFGKEYMRSSLSPQLSRLKARGEVALKGKNWRLAKEDPAEAGSENEGAGQSGAGLPIHGPAGANPAASTPNSSEVAASEDDAEERARVLFSSSPPT